MTSSRAVSIEEARFLARKLRHAVGATADDSALMRVLAHNGEVVRLAEREDGGEPGFVAYLPLRPEGLVALTDGRLDRRNPDTALLCRAGETPVALYMWCVYSPGNFIPAIAAIAAHFEEIAPGGVPLFTSAATAPAARLFASLGFKRAIDYFPEADDDVLVVFRNEPAPDDGGGGGGPEGYEKSKPAEKKADNHDTIALLVLGANGNIAGGCSTSGLGGKLPGRVGDSPIIGSGLYVDNEVGAAGATGIGENVMRYCASFLIVEFMRQGMSPQEACGKAIRRIIQTEPKGANLSINFVALDKQGRYGAAGTDQGFQYSVTMPGSSRVLPNPGIGPLER